MTRGGAKIGKLDCQEPLRWSFVLLEALISQLDTQHGAMGACSPGEVRGTHCSDLSSTDEKEEHTSSDVIQAKITPCTGILVSSATLAVCVHMKEPMLPISAGIPDLIMPWFCST